MPKATQAGRGDTVRYTQGQGESLTSVIFDNQTCYICGKKTLPWGVILRGKACVCSKTCHDTYWKTRFDK